MLNELILLASRHELFSFSGLPGHLVGLVFQSLFLVAGWRIFKNQKGREVPHASIPGFGSESKSNKGEPASDNVGQTDSSSSAQRLLDSGASLEPHKNEGKEGRWRTQEKRNSSSDDSLNDSAFLALSEEKKKVALLTSRLKMEEEKVARLETAANSPAAAAAARQSLVERNRITGERNQFESQLKKLKSEYSQLADQHADSKRELDTVYGELVRLQKESKRSVSSGEFNLVQNELFQSQSILAKLKTEILDLQSSLAQASQRESVAVSELGSKSECIDELRDQVDLLESELIKAKELAHHFEASLCEKEGAVTEAVLAAEKVKSELQGAEANSARMQNEFEAEVGRLQNVVDELTNEKVQLSAKFDGLRKTHAELDDRLAEQTTTQTEKTERLQNALDSAAREIVTQEQEIKRLAFELKQKHLKINSFQATDSEQEQLRSLLKQSQAAEAALGAKVRGLKKTQAELNDQLAEQTTSHAEKVEHLQNALDSAARESVTQEREVQRLAFELKQKHLEIDGLRAADSEQEELRSLLNRSQAVETSLKATIEGLSEEKRSWDAEVEQLSAMNIDLRNERDVLNRALVSAEESTKELQKSHARSESRVKQSEAELEAARIELEQAVSELEKVNRLIVERDQRLEKAEAETKESLRLREQVAESFEKIELLTTELEGSRDESSRLHNSIVAKEEEIAKLKTVNQQLTGENERLDQEHQTDLEQLDGLRDSVAQQRGQLAANETEQVRLSEQIAELNKEREDMLKATRHQESVEQDMAEELQATIETRDSYRQRRRELKKKYKVLFRKWEISKTGLLDAQGQFCEFQQRLEKAEKENEKLNLLLNESIQQLRTGEDQFREFGVKYRKIRLRYKRYKSRMLKYKLLLEAYCRVTGLTPTMIAKRDSSGSPRIAARPDDPVKA